MTAFNTVRFNLKPGREQEFLDAHQKAERNWPGLRHANLIKTGDQSYCILVTDKLSEAGRERIRTMVESNDGFYIAEMDMKLRGPGEFFGTKQSGLPAFRVANILRDPDILELARHEAIAFTENPPSAGDLQRAVAYIQSHWQRRYGLVLVG